MVSLQHWNCICVQRHSRFSAPKRDSTARTDYKAKLPVCNLNVMVYQIQIIRDPFESCAKLGTKLEQASVATLGMAWQNGQKRARHVSMAGPIKGGVIGVKYQT